MHEKFTDTLNRWYVPARTTFGITSKTKKQEPLGLLLSNSIAQA